jgi:hypothetical protein
MIVERLTSPDANFARKFLHLGQFDVPQPPQCTAESVHLHAGGHESRAFSGAGALLLHGFLVSDHKARRV